MVDIKQPADERKAESIANKLNATLGFSAEGKNEPQRAFYPVTVNGVSLVRFTTRIFKEKTRNITE